MFYFTAAILSILGAFLCWDSSARIPAIVAAVIAFSAFFVAKRYFPIASEIPKQIFVVALLTLISAAGFILFGLVSSMNPGLFSSAGAHH